MIARQSPGRRCTARACRRCSRWCSGPQVSDIASWECCENGGLEALDDHSRDKFMTRYAVIAPFHWGNPHEQRPNSHTLKRV
jgi:hypothetical protein